jgi:hypothetical protein
MCTQCNITYTVCRHQQKKLEPCKRAIIHSKKFLACIRDGPGCKVSHEEITRLEKCGNCISKERTMARQQWKRDFDEKIRAKQEAFYAARRYNWDRRGVNRDSYIEPGLASSLSGMPGADYDPYWQH